MNILILLTANMSLKKWHKFKIFNREIKIYKELSELGFKFTFLTWGTTDEKKYLKNNLNFDVINIFRHKNNLFKFNVFRYLYSIYYIFKNRKIFQRFNLIKSNQLIGSHLGLVFKLLFNTKFICRLGYEPNEFFTHKKNFLLILVLKIYSKFIYKFSDKIIVTTNLTKNFICKNFKIKKKKIVVIPNFIDTKIFNGKLKKKNNFKKFVTVTRLDEQKNLIFMFEEILNSNFNLDVIGLSKKIFLKYKKDFKMNSRINFLGRVENTKLSSMFAKYDFYLSTSKYEGNPKTILEAMSSNLPVISTKAPGITNIIKDKKNGFIIEEKGGSLIKKIYEIKKINKLNKIVDNARQYIESNNSLKNIIKRESRLYLSLLK